jgi:hypothetical protein
VLPQINKRNDFSEFSQRSDLTFKMLWRDVPVINLRIAKAQIRDPVVIEDASTTTIQTLAEWLRQERRPSGRLFERSF